MGENAPKMKNQTKSRIGEAEKIVRKSHSFLEIVGGKERGVLRLERESQPMSFCWSARY